MQWLLTSRVVRPKLTVTRPGEASERRADEMAERIMHMPRPVILPECAPCERDKKLHRRAEGSSAPAMDASATTLLASLGPGQPLPAGERAFFEPRFGRAFDDVSVHMDPPANEAARSLRARAFTLGAHIAFGPGQYAPQTSQGARLLAHELTHTLQPPREPPAVMRDGDEPSAPVMTTTQSKDFIALKEGELVPDPTGGAHGITVQRRGDELDYLLRGGDRRRVPRPRTGGKVDTIKSITWGLPQEAFAVDYVVENFTPFAVNVFGLGRFQTFADVVLRRPAALEVLPGGLELERSPGILSPGRPVRAKDSIRYRVPGGAHSLYLAKDRSVQIVDDVSGKTVLTYFGVVDLRVTPDGSVELTWKEDSDAKTVQLSLRGSRLGLHGLGTAGDSASRQKLLADLRGLGIKIEEKGSRFSEVELQAASDLLKAWKGAKSVVDSLKALKVPGLTLRKDVLTDSASYDTDTGIVLIGGGVVASSVQERNAVIHELTHALFHARGFYVPGKGKAPIHVTKEAEELHELSDLDLIKEGYIRSRPKAKRTIKEWEAALSTDAEVNELWRDLHTRFKIGDPEGTGDIRGIDVADESRYGVDPRGDPVGHAHDNVTEFLASFVSSSLLFEAQMARTVQDSGSLELAGLYRRLWARVNSTLATLGSTNPFDAVVDALRKRP